jgi:hypothetical protein
MTNLQSSLQRALDGLQDALEVLPDPVTDPNWAKIDIGIAIKCIRYAARVNKIKLAEKESL